MSNWQEVQCPICDSPNAKMERSSKRSFLGSLFGTNSPNPRALCACSNCRQEWTVDERDGTIWEADKAQVRGAREEWQRRGSVGPDIVCNGTSGGTGAHVYGFNEGALSWLRANVSPGRWVRPLRGLQALEVSVEEASQIASKASAAGLQVRINDAHVATLAARLRKEPQ